MKYKAIVSKELFDKFKNKEVIFKCRKRNGKRLHNVKAVINPCLALVSDTAVLFDKDECLGFYTVPITDKILCFVID